MGGTIAGGERIALTQKTHLPVDRKAGYVPSLAVISKAWAVNWPVPRPSNACAK
jgi:hypothetical protein